MEFGPSRPKRPDSNHEDGCRRRTRGTSYERGRKRSRSRSHDRERVGQSRELSAEACVLRRDRSESQTLASSSEPPPPGPPPQAVKGKGKAAELSRVVDGLGPSTGGSEAERAAIDKSIGSAHSCELPNAEHTVIDGSKHGKRDRAPDALTLRQSVQALEKTEPLKVSRSAAEHENRIPGPNLRHGHPSLLERISGMEGAPNNRLVPASAVHPDLSTSQESVHPLRSATAQPERFGAASSNININYAQEDIIDIDNHHPDPVSDVIHQDNATAQFECADRVPRVNPKDVLERTRVRLAKMKNVAVAGISPTAPTPPPIRLDPSTPAEPETATPIPIGATLRNKLLERLESERRRAIGAAPGEPDAEPDAGGISEDSLKAELRARNQLRTRLAVAKADRRAGNLGP